jgi:hypothetical protein
VPIHKIVPNPKNPNKHGKRQIELLAKLIDHQGFRHPIIVSNRSGFICAGHARLEAAKLLKYEDIPVDYQDFESEAQEYAFLVSDNKIQELAEHDDLMMLDEIKTLQLDDLELLGLDKLNFDVLKPIEEFEELNNEKASEDKQYILIAQFPNEMEMMDAHDNLLNQGYIVKIK